MTEEFPSNSNKDREEKVRQAPARGAAEPKKIERITEGDVIRRKKPLSKRLKETFLGGDSKSVWSYVTMDVLIPAAKDMITDAGTQAIERMIYGESRRPGRGFRPSSGPTRYDAYSRSSGYNSSSPPWQRDAQTRPVSARARATHDFDEIILDSRGEAEQVIDQLIEIISQYNQASVSDLYAMVGITPAYTDQKYGWSELRGANVSRAGGGFLLNLPKPEPLD